MGFKLAIFVTNLAKKMFRSLVNVDFQNSRQLILAEKSGFTRQCNEYETQRSSLYYM